MQLVEPPHQGKIGRRNRPGQIIDAAPCQPQSLGLTGDRQSVLAVDHFLALTRPALVSAPSKKSFSSVSSPILAWSVFTSTAGEAGATVPLPPNTPVAPSSSWAFHCVIWLA